MRKNVKQAKRLARAAAYWMERLQPQLPDLDSHDVHLVILNLLRRHPLRRRLLNEAFRHG